MARGSIIRYFSLRQRLHMPIYFVKGARVAYTNHSLSDVGRQLGALLVFVQGVVPVASRAPAAGGTKDANVICSKIANLFLFFQVFCITDLKSIKVYLLCVCCAFISTPATDKM